jgi:hypothetical protein
LNFSPTVGDALYVALASRSFYSCHQEVSGEPLLVPGKQYNFQLVPFLRDAHPLAVVSFCDDRRRTTGDHQKSPRKNERRCSGKKRHRYGGGYFCSNISYATPVGIQYLCIWPICQLYKAHIRPNNQTTSASSFPPACHRTTSSLAPPL